ncbi:hypothetical protein ABH926_005770 [Catenulispora sp. GP43]|uniref:hypothetical protein n=1 Tax=Catenulispora sp. GP43 TaxID=3156263 RepID=UPI003514168E
MKPGAVLKQGTGVKQWVDDDVWQQLDPHAGGLSRRQRRRAAAAATAAAVVLVAGFAIDRSGLVRAQITYDPDTGLQSSATVNPKVFTQQVPVKNNGWTTVRVTGIGHDGPGLRLVGPTDTGELKQASEMGGRQPPFDLRPGQTAIMVVAYRVTDCAAVPAGPLLIPVRVERPWGTETISLSSEVPMDQACPPQH